MPKHQGRVDEQRFKQIVQVHRYGVELFCIDGVVVKSVCCVIVPQLGMEIGSFGFCFGLGACGGCSPWGLNWFSFTPFIGDWVEWCNALDTRSFTTARLLSEDRPSHE